MWFTKKLINTDQIETQNLFVQGGENIWTHPIQSTS